MIIILLPPPGSCRSSQANRLTSSFSLLRRTSRHLHVERGLALLLLLLLPVSSVVVCVVREGGGKYKEGPGKRVAG